MEGAGGHHGSVGCQVSVSAVRRDLDDEIGHIGLGEQSLLLCLLYRLEDGSAQVINDRLRC